MAESDGQERTEDATSRRRQQATEKGQIPRSKELASVAVMFFGVISLWMMGDELGASIGRIMTRLFSLSRGEIYDFELLKRIIASCLSDLLYPLGTILIILFCASLLGAVGLGGIHFSTEGLMPKLSKINPATGLKRMFGKQSIIELVKSILKITLIGGVAFWLMRRNLPNFFDISREVYPLNIIDALRLLLHIVLIIICSLLIVVAIDIPFQIFQHNQQLKMTKQEVKDENKETEGNPQVKGRLRQLQREATQRRMMADVPTADVIVTNPEHYSVALRYDQSMDKAPVVVAKGVDNIAMKIREVANEYDIEIVPAPPLARALYYNTDLEQQIPDGLFVAVAQILAYVFQLKAYRRGQGQRPSNPVDDNMYIPEELRHS